MSIKLTSDSCSPAAVGIEWFAGSLVALDGSAQQRLGTRGVALGNYVK